MLYNYNIIKTEVSNIEYIALYRKYRPKTFLEVVGQEHITKTLKNQIKSHRIAHAYLFNGPRGTGKTSVAKILSRAINCLNNIDGDPCNECENCKGIIDGSIMDVIEIDAASNNSVDNVRNIRDEIIYTPTKAKYKVYIIDEVHMLSTGAFNALLKTLEEPPSHIIFILATTEPQKLPATIISRCQRYDFKRIGTGEIKDRLKEVADDIGIKIEDFALEIIAGVSEGGLRDALSILDQCASLCDNVTYKDVQSIMGMVDKDSYFDISAMVIKKDIGGIIESINNIYYQGKDINHFIIKLISHYRDLLIVKVVDKSVDTAIINKNDYDRLKDISLGYTRDQIINIINILSEVLTESKKTTYSKILLEAGLIKVCSLGDFTKEEKKKTITKEEKKEQKDEKPVEKENNKEKTEAKSRPGDIMEKWDQILEDLKRKGQGVLVVECLKEISIDIESEKTLIINIPKDGAFLSQKMQDRKLVEEIRDSILKVTGKDLKIKTTKKEEKEEDYIKKFKDSACQKGFEKIINEI